MKIIDGIWFDVTIEKKEDGTEVAFYFDIERVNKINTSASANEDDDIIYKVAEILYGRIVIGGNSYFSEIAAFVNPDDDGHLTYHILFIDTLFNKKYVLNTSNSDFKNYKNFHLL